MYICVHAYMYVHVVSPCAYMHAYIHIYAYTYIWGEVGEVINNLLNSNHLFGLWPFIPIVRMKLKE